ncbi:MAG: AI-2E family transporter [Woeseiaceae bacterium]|nr:AI-2E family transporter [Woeseiaceae bacterium]
MEIAKEKSTNALISVAAIIVIVYGLQAAKVLLVPFLLAVFLSLITFRPMLWLQQKRVPSIAAALLIVIGLMLILGGVGGVVGTSIAEFTAALPRYQARLDTIVRGTSGIIAKMLGEEQAVVNISELIDPGWAMGMAANILNALQDVLTNTFLIMFTLVFILLEASGIGVKVQAAFGRSADSLRNQRQFLHNLGRYMGIKTAISLATGASAWLVTWWIGLDFPLLWGMLAFLLNFIPAIGSIIAAIPAILLALVQLGIAEASYTAIGFLGINILFGNFLEPRLMGYGVGISPLIVFTGLVLWGWIFGPVGMLLSVPLTMALKMALEADDSTRWLAILIGSERDAEYALMVKKKDQDRQAPIDKAAG